MITLIFVALVSVYAGATGMAMLVSSKQRDQPPEPDTQPDATELEMHYVDGRTMRVGCVIDWRKCRTEIHALDMCPCPACRSYRQRNPFPLPQGAPARA